MKRARGLFGVALALLLLALAALLWRQSTPLAVVTARDGEVVRDHEGSVGVWVAAPRGAELELGDGLWSRESARAELTLDSGARLIVPSRARIRFGARAGGAALLVDEGEVELLAPAEVSLRVGDGVVRLEPGSRAVVSAREVRLVLGVGEIEVDGAARPLRIEPDAGAPPPTPEGGLETSTSADALTTDETTTGETATDETTNETTRDDPRPAGEPSRPAPRPLFVVSPGDRVRVHDPTPPTPIGFRSPPRCEDPAVRVGGRSYAGASAFFDAGANRYEVLCGRRVRATGRVRVVRDSGTRAVPSTPPTSELTLDGRRYRVGYQSLPPRIHVAWPGGPSRGVLRVAPERGRAREIPTAFPATLRSGQIREGRYTITGVSGARTSPSTRLSVRFDNPATSLSLRSPSERGFGAGETITVSGLGLPGWRLGVGDAALPLDASGRFEAALRAPADRSGIAVRATHPRHGTRYYVRRIRDAPTSE